MFAEGIGTAILMFAILGIVDTRSPGDFAGLVIGGVVVAIIMVLGPLTGASLNPARAFGPELVSAIGGGATHWNQCLPVYMLPGAGRLRGRGRGLRLPRHTAPAVDADRATRSPTPTRDDYVVAKPE